MSLASIASRLTSWFMRKTSLGGIRRIATFQAAISTDVGLTRDSNEDRVALARGYNHYGQPYVIAAVCDGIGGMRDGATCAAMTLGSFFAAFCERARTDSSPEEVMRAALQIANDTVHRQYGGKGGSTLSAVLVTAPDHGYAASVGDSRIYRYNDGLLQQLTVDDTIAGQLGKPAAEDLGTQLIQYVGMGDALETSIDELNFRPRDALLLTSDGIHSFDGKWLRALLQHASEPGTALKRLTDTANWLGGRDNASAALLTPQLVFASETMPPYAASGLDIWDPFGEVQILVEHIIDPAPDAPYLREQTPAQDYRVLPRDDKSQLSVAKATKAKKKRERKGRGALGKTAKLTSSGKSTVPQLRIDFPKKS